MLVLFGTNTPPLLAFMLFRSANTTNERAARLAKFTNRIASHDYISGLGYESGRFVVTLFLVLSCLFLLLLCALLFLSLLGVCLAVSWFFLLLVRFCALEILGTTLHTNHRSMRTSPNYHVAVTVFIVAAPFIPSSKPILAFAFAPESAMVDQRYNRSVVLLVILFYYLCVLCLEHQWPLGQETQPFSSLAFLWACRTRGRVA